MSKITLSTLPQATAQEVFDQVATHLLQQGVQSVNTDGECQYRSGTLMCAAGCLIGESEYDGSLEGIVWEDLLVSGKVPVVHSTLIQQLQIIHDDSRESTNWFKHLIRLAENHKLSTDALTQFQENR